MVADDTNLSCEGLTSREIEAKLYADLESVDRWLTVNKLTLNNSKAEFIYFNRSRYLLTNFEDNLEIT